MSTRILFVCTANAARSQIAEGLARSLAPNVEVASAGSRPSLLGVHPLAVEVMRERGIDISRQRPKGIADVPGEFDYVITLCDDAAQNCPVVPARRARLHWSLADPAGARGELEMQRQLFRDIRDDIESRLCEWLGGLGLLSAGK